MSTTARPKAVLYTFKQSFWGASAEWAAHEKGYGEDELEIRSVNVVKGETFAPSFLRINPKGTIPALVVPHADTSEAVSETKYRVLTDSVDILEYLDKSRSNLSGTGTTLRESAPSLSPTSVEASSLSATLINLSHAPENDPAFLMLSAKDSGELQEKSAGFVGGFVVGRAKAMEESLAQEDLEPEVKAFLEEKKRGMLPFVSLFTGKASKEEKEAYFAKSKEAWEVALPKAFATIEANMIGPYMLGDQLSLADIHVGVWLVRVVRLSYGRPAKDAEKWPELLSALTGPLVADFKVGPKVAAFWDGIVAREAFKKVYAGGLR